MKIKMLALLSALIFITVLSGCVQYNIALEMDDNNIDKITVQIAYNEALLENLGEGEEADVQDELNTPLKEMGFLFDDTPNNNVVVTPITFEENGMVFKGTSYEVTYENESVLESTDERFKVIPLKDNTYRLQLKLNVTEEVEEVDASVENNEYLDMLGLLGGKMEFRIKTSSNVISHNADKVINGEYIWDLLSRFINNTGESEVFYIEYKVSEDAYVKNPVREEFIKKYNLAPNDPDFYGKALQKINILYGTDKGLELDSELLRLQGALIYARLLGLEDKIEEFAKTNPDYDSGFTDVPDWAKPTMNYLFYNKLVYGKGNNLYGSYDPMSEAQFTALVLRALGYSEANGDFVFVEAPQKAYELGFYISDTSDYEIKNSDRLTRRDMCYIAFNGLFVQNKEKSGYLIDNLTAMK
ncbi:MAG: hypothetical protein GX022_05705 [Clostridiaceae bacterium]|nr:hypothetical protein [Clostridiaceae bacterium]